MKHKNYLSILTLMVTFILAACSSEDYTDDPIFDQEIKTELVDKSELPQWLADYVTYLEYVPEGQELPTEKSGIYRFEWNGETYYEYYSTSQIAMHTDIYTSKGKPYFLKESDYKAFSEEVRNWTIVYLLNFTHEKQEGILYPSHCSDSIQEFFERTLSDDDYYRSKFVFQYEDTPKDGYIINSQKQLESIYIGSDSLPDIDFDDYTLILAKMPVKTNYSYKRQEIDFNSSDIINRPMLKLYFERPPDSNVPVDTVITQYTWALYPKNNNESLYVNVMCNFQETDNFTIYKSSLSHDPSAMDPSDWDVQTEENGEISFRCFQPGNEELEKLYSCPSCLEDVAFLLPLSEDNEIRRISQGILPFDDGVFHFMEFYEHYQQYYKGVPVLNDGKLIYLLTPKGKRMTNGWFRGFFDIKDLDVTPDITKEQAVRIFSNFTNLTVELSDEYYETVKLYVGVFDSEMEGKNVRSAHLYYLVVGPRGNYAGILVPPYVALYSGTPCVAMIDAHTGEILKTNYEKSQESL